MQSVQGGMRSECLNYVGHGMIDLEPILYRCERYSLAAATNLLLKRGHKSAKFAVK